MTKKEIQKLVSELEMLGGYEQKFEGLDIYGDAATMDMFVDVWNDAIKKCIKVIRGVKCS